MTLITILLRHSGTWIASNVYDKFKSDGIVLNDYDSYEVLISTISNHLEIDILKFDIQVRYIVEGNESAMEIRNNMGMRLYMELKKKNSNVGVYPLILTTQEKLVADSIFGKIAYELNTGAIACIEGSESGVLAITGDGNVDSLSVMDMDVDHVITDCNHKVVRVDQLYKDKDTLVSVMANHAIVNRYQFRTERSDKKSYYLICNSEECPWSFRFSSLNNSSFFLVRSFYDVHPCQLKDKLFNQRQTTSGFIDGLVAPKCVNHKRKISSKDIQEDHKRDLGVDINYMKAWRGKEQDMKMVRGDPTDSYQQLPGYLYMLDQVYPNSYLRMHNSPRDEFMYIFISLNPMRIGFEYCRPVVVVDGAHMRGAYQGTFVSASTLDGAGCILPLAYGVVDTENDASWTWFFEQFKGAFGERPNMCVVSYRNESIIKSVSRVFPAIPHYACIWRLWKNVCTNFRKSIDRLSDVYYAMAKAYKVDDFDYLIGKVDKMDHRVKDYLFEAGYEKWARVHAPINRGRIMTSNIAKCINECLFDARELPIFYFLKKTRILFGEWNCSNGAKAKYTGTPLCGKFQQMLVLNESESPRMTVRPSSEFLYTVSVNGRKYIVCLERKTCCCGRFQLDELPCPHAIVVLKSKNIDDFGPYCSDYYKPGTLVKTYELPVCSLPDQKEWKIPESISAEVVLPPIYRRPPGRPKKGRHKKSSETLSKSSNCYGRCGRKGHNMRSCSYFPKKK